MPLPTAAAVLHLSKKHRWEAVVAALKTLESVSRKESPTSEEATSTINQLSTGYDVRTGNTVGHFAAGDDQVEILGCLLRLGVDLRKSNFSNRSPMQEARNKDKQNAVEFILGNVYSPVESLFYGDDTYSNMVDVLSRYPEAMDDVLECYNNMTWACLCVEEGRLKELKWLYEHGAKFDVTDDCGNTLLHMAPLPFAETSALSDSELSEGSSTRRKLSDSSSAESYEGRSPSREIDRTEVRNESSEKRVCRPTSEVPSSTERSLKEDLPEVTKAHSDSGAIQEEDEILGVLGPLSDFSHDEVKALRVLAFLLSTRFFHVNQCNTDGSTPAHVMAERSNINPTVAWRALRLLHHCGADFNIQDNEGLTVAMVLASSCGDGPWLSWVLLDIESGGGGCDPNITDVKGRRVEDHIVTANLATFDAELDVDEESEEEQFDDDNY